MLLERLIEKQRELKESDTAFAAGLGVSAELWRLTRRGDRRIMWGVLRGAARRFPELSEEMALFLVGDGNVLPSDGKALAEVDDDERDLAAVP